MKFATVAIAIAIASASSNVPKSLAFAVGAARRLSSNPRYHRKPSIPSSSGCLDLPPRGGGSCRGGVASDVGEITSTSDGDVVSVVAIDTSPIGGMRPGTSGLRKKVDVWKTENYVENFVQCLIDTAMSSNGGRVIDT